ncbi:hypothetical protein F5X98DRAFT_389971 [Xylaria grammica]|nr:hypothetical protein F5X98DRAFT_389971 [Xylaria grammica]
MMQPSPSGSGRSVETAQATLPDDDLDVTLDSEGSTTASTPTAASNNSTTVAPLTSSHDSGIPMSTLPDTPRHIEDGYTSDDSSLSYDSNGMPRMLEALPPELRIQILSSMPDLETLRSIIRSSPTMHTQYLYARHKILSTCLDRELDGFYVDAYANLKSRPIDLGWARFNKTIDDFLNSYHGWLAASDSYPCAESLPPSRVRWMAAYHISVARPLVRRYGSWALKNLEGGLSSAAQINITLSGTDSELSRSEEVRIFRALYRHDTYHHLYGQNMGNRCGYSEYDGGDNGTFFNLFNPWDNEGISCFDTFIRQQWGYLFDRARDDVNPKTINFNHCGDVYAPDGSYNLYEDRELYETGMVSRGLKMIARFLTIHDHQDLVSAMERCLIGPGPTDDSLHDSLHPSTQMQRRRIYPTARDQAEQRGDQMSFAGDSLLPDEPPLAWVALWGGRYVNFYGRFVPESLKLWGFVMWDARRWADVGEDGLKDLFVEHWKADHQAVRSVSHYTGWKPLDVEI